MRLLLVNTTILALLIAGCSDPPPTTTPPPAVPPPTTTPPPAVTPAALTYRPCAAAQRVGGFTVERARDFTAVEGRVLSGVVPASVRSVAASEGACKLLRGRVLFCDPACGAGQTCGEAGACIAYPVAQSVGVVTLSGLLVPLQMRPTSVNFYSSAAVTLPHPAYQDGASIALRADGLALSGAGVPALEVPVEAFALERGQPLVVNWTKSGTSAVAKVQIVLDLAHHGGIAASLDCDGVDDTGRFEVPAALVTGLLDVGVAGFPKITLSRRTVDSANLAAGCVELAVVSRVDRAITISGLESCVTDDECTQGKICQADLTCR